MSYKHQDPFITENMRQLIKLLTGYEESDVNFAICEQFALSSIKNHRFLSADSHAIKRSMSGLIEKFRIHGHFEASEKLQILFESFVNQIVFKNHDQYDIKWSLISLMINLAYNPTGALIKNNSCSKSSEISVDLVQDENTLVDWQKVLTEGIDLRKNYDTDSLSSWTESESDSNDTHIVLFPEIPLSPLDLPLCVNSTPNKKLVDSYSEDLETCDSNIQGDEWLPKQKLQPAWWECGATFDAQSALPAANLAKDWNNYLKTLSYGLIESENVLYINEYCIIREVIWLMQVPQTPNKSRMFSRDSKNVFHVKGGITIPSLTAGTLHELLSPFCSYMTILFELYSFSERVYNSALEENLAPFTYEAYNEAIMKLLEPLKMYLIQLEETVRLQDDVFTLLTLQSYLKSYAETLQTLYTIHKDCILDWQNTPSSICAVVLLTKLYRKCYTQNAEAANLSFVLFINSLKVFMNIITSWLNGGRLEDWREEFSICVQQDPDSDFDGFCLREYPEKYNIDKDNLFFKTLLRRVLYAGQSISILQKLDRVHEMLKQVEIRTNLYSILLKTITEEISRYDKNLLASESILNIADCEESYGKLNFVPEIGDVLLKSVFHKYICRNDAKDNSDLDQGLDINKLYERLNSIPYIPLKAVLDKVLNQILNTNCMQACRIVVDILKEHFQLQKHLDALQNIILMHASGPMYNFYNHLFNEMESGNSWKTPYYLTGQLEAFLSYSQFSNMSHLFSIDMQNSTVTVNNNLKAFENLRITYCSQYPLSLVVTQEDLSKYQECMQFLVKVNWSLWALQNLTFTSELRKRPDYIHVVEVNSRKLQILRFWLLHAVGSIHSYLFGQVLVTAKINLQRSIDSANVLEDLIVAHKEFIDDVHEHCLLVPKHKPIQQIILQLLKLVQMVRAEWLDRFEIKLEYNSETSLCGHDDISDWEQICLMESIYKKCHLFLQDIFKNNLANGDNEELSGLCFSFNCNVHNIQGIIS